MVPILGSLVDLQVHEDIGKQSIFNLFNEVMSSAVVSTTRIILFQAVHTVACARNMLGCSHTTGITYGNPSDPEGPLWLCCDLNIPEGCV